MRYYIKAFQNYFNSDGRATRKELWLFFLCHYLISCVLSFFDGYFGFYFEGNPFDPFNLGYLALAYFLVSICPLLCVQVRRLHDVNKSGSCLWLLFVPLFSFYLLVLYMQPGDPEINNYGPPPGQPHTAEPLPMIPPQEQSSIAQGSSIEEAPVQSFPDVPHPQPDPSSQVKFCWKCGFKLLPGSNFCSRCGTAVAKE